MESVKICCFKTFPVGKFYIKNLFIAFFSTIYMLKGLFCEIISVEYEFKSEKFKGSVEIT